MKNENKKGKIQQFRYFSIKAYGNNTQKTIRPKSRNINISVRRPPMDIGEIIFLNKQRKMMAQYKDSVS